MRKSKKIKRNALENCSVAFNRLLASDAPRFQLLANDLLRSELAALGRVIISADRSEELLDLRATQSVRDEFEGVQSFG